MKTAFEWIVNIGAIAGAVHAVIALWSKFRSPIPNEIARSTRSVLVDAQEVIDSSIQWQGALHYPWAVRGGNIELKDIKVKLEETKSHLKRKNICESIDEVISALEGIYKYQPERVFFYSDYETLEDRARNSRNKELHAMQLEVAKKGKASVEAAIKAVDEKTAKH